MARDTLFNTTAPVAKFEFNEQVADVFDDMLDRSVPFYKQVIEMSAEILNRSLEHGDTVYDLGCSTGNTLLYLGRLLDKKEIRLIGVDSSQCMLDKAFKKARMFKMAERMEFCRQDITEVDLSGAGGIILNYTLQFISLQSRLKFLKNIHEGLRSGGVLILSEKIISEDKGFNEHFQASYYHYKMKRGYSELEIAKKREALEDVLIPLSSRENKNLLEQAGFNRIETFFQWFNFISFMAYK